MLALFQEFQRICSADTDKLIFAQKTQRFQIIHTQRNLKYDTLSALYDSHICWIMLILLYSNRKRTFSNLASGCSKQLSKGDQRHAFEFSQYPT